MTQRIEGMEGSIQKVLAEGMEAFQETLAENAQKNQENIDAATTRLEGKFDRFREDQNNQMAAMKGTRKSFKKR